VLNGNASLPYTALLTCHPEIHNPAVHGIEVRICRMRGGVLALTYVLRGDIARLRIPSLRQARQADRLWQHTCFEAFVATKGSAAYCEFNFAPSGEWAAYSFRRYRDGSPLIDAELAPQIAVRDGRDRLELDATVRTDRLAIIRPHSVLRLGLSAVLEAKGGILSYWALKHPQGKPDFHHSDSFALEFVLDMGPVDALSAEK
jgi:hypothetical protein